MGTQSASMNQPGPPVLTLTGPVITQTSEHFFDSLDHAHRFVQLLARVQGFAIHRHPERKGEAGSWQCAHAAVRATKAQKEAVPAVIDTVNVPLIETAVKAGSTVNAVNQRANCLWHIRWNKQSDGRIKLTSRTLDHAQHPMHPTSSLLPRLITDYVEILAEEQQSLESLLKKGVKGDELLRSITMDPLGADDRACQESGPTRDGLGWTSLWRITQLAEDGTPEQSETEENRKGDSTSEIQNQIIHQQQQEAREADHEQRRTGCIECWHEEGDSRRHRAL